MSQLLVELKENYNMLKVDLSSWVGNTETTEGVLDINTAAMLHAIFDTSGVPAPIVGDEMMPLAHWSAFSPKVPMAAVSNDGHPKLGQFMPPVKLERRMWAGGDVTFLSPMRVGVPMRRNSSISAMTEKEGDSGPMVFVTVSQEMFQEGTLCAREVNNIVYLDIPETFSPPKAKPIPADADFAHDVDVNEALLFRYSAATFNAHRIHYDLSYAQEVEKYPGLVVHGPLQAIWLIRAAMAHANRSPEIFSFRGVHPVFHRDAIRLYGHSIDEGMRLCTGVGETHQGMQATVKWRPDT